jgi:hypothetical protein
MRATFELPGHHRSGAHADALAPLDELRRRPFPVRAVRRRHVLCQRREAAAHVAHGVAGHALVRCKTLQQAVGDAQLDLGTDEPVRNAVVVGLELDVIVDVDLGRLPDADGIPGGGQRSQRRSVALFEGTAPAAGQLLEGPPVQVDDQLGDGTVQFGQTEEPAVAQACEDPSLHEEHRTLDLRLVAWMRRTCCEYSAAIVLGEFLIGPVRFGVVAIGMLDQRAGLIGDDQAGHATDEFERTHLSADPVGGRLALSRAGIGEFDAPSVATKICAWRISPVAASMMGTVEPA